MQLKQAATAMLALTTLMLALPMGQTKADEPYVQGGSIYRLNNGLSIASGYYNTPITLNQSGAYPLSGWSGSLSEPYGQDLFESMMNPVRVRFGPNDIPRTSDALVVKREANDRLFFRWQGEPRAVRSITIALLDQDNKIQKQQRITSLPAEGRLTRTKDTAAYVVYIEYINGTTNSIQAPL